MALDVGRGVVRVDVHEVPSAAPRIPGARRLSLIPVMAPDRRLPRRVFAVAAHDAPVTLRSVLHRRRTGLDALVASCAAYGVVVLEVNAEHHGVVHELVSSHKLDVVGDRRLDLARHLVLHDRPAFDLVEVFVNRGRPFRAFLRGRPSAFGTTLEVVSKVDLVHRGEPVVHDDEVRGSPANLDAVQAVVLRQQTHPPVRLRVRAVIAQDGKKHVLLLRSARLDQEPTVFATVKPRAGFARCVRGGYDAERRRGR